MFLFYIYIRNVESIAFHLQILGEKRAVEVSCGVALRDLLTEFRSINKFFFPFALIILSTCIYNQSNSTILVEQAAGISEILKNPDVDYITIARTISSELENLAATQLCTNLHYMATQSRVQHKQYSYLASPFAELQKKLVLYSRKYSSVKKRKTALEYQLR